MLIDHNEKEKSALAAMRQGDKQLGHRLEDEFVAEAKAAGGHCSCANATCRHHGDCVACVVIHRGHRDHLPACLQDMLNERLESLSALTEHSMCDRRK